jgi:hypothetical protein
MAVDISSITQSLLKSLRVLAVNIVDGADSRQLAF